MKCKCNAKVGPPFTVFLPTKQKKSHFIYYLALATCFVELYSKVHYSTSAVPGTTLHFSLEDLKKTFATLL
jgi:hypothetical protein